MTDTGATERVTKALFEAIMGVIDQTRETADEEALDKIGPVLLSTGAMVLVQGIGVENSARVIRDLAARVERGDFCITPPGPTQ